MPRSRYDDDDEDDRPRRSRRDDDEDDDRPARSRRRDDDEDDPPKKAGGGKTLWIVLGIVGGVLLVCGGLGAWGIVWLVGKGKEQADRRKVETNYKLAGMGAHNYESANGYLPSPYIRKRTEFAGQVPSDLSDRLGWRVALLPYIQQDSLFRQFDTEQPWNGGPNQPHSSKVIQEYADTDTPTDPATRVRCFYDNGAVFDTKQQVRITDIYDGTSNTILYVEGGEKVTWTRFQEYKFDPNGGPPPLGKPDKPDFMVVMGDGSVRRIKKTVNPTVLKAAITRSGGEAVWLDD